MATIRLFLSLFLILSFAGIAGAELIRPNLPIGTKYQLVFITSGKRSGASSNIDNYNNFVRTEAALNPDLPSVVWNAVGSTLTVNAKDNAPSNGLPVYNTHGELVTATPTGLYTGSLTLDHKVLYDQYGTILPHPAGSVDNYAWTGTTTNGTGMAGHQLGSQVFDSAKYTDPYGTTWLGGGVAGFTNNLRMLALSEEITMGSGPASGDFNADGKVDAADYVMWRKTATGQTNYDIWRSHFGQTAGSGSSLNANTVIPEPATLATLIIGVVGYCVAATRFTIR